jgi:uncharacterized membrane protein YuzA (DUF378 family)
MEMTTLDKVTYLLVVIGGLNWGIVGLFEKDLVGEIFGYGETISRIVYVAIGASAAYMFYKMVVMINEKKK